MFKKLDNRVLLAVCTLVLLFGAACQKKCQPAEAKAFKSLVDTPWRLVESSDPDVARELDRFNFLIVTFSRNNTGVVNRVVDNDQYDTPIMQLVWVPDPQARMLRIQYSSSTFNDGTGAGDAGTFDYFYALGRQLEMYESDRGYYYRYVPFKGIVDPDSSCVF